MQPYRLGVAGCGGEWGHGTRGHIAPGIRLGRFTLGGVFDTNPIKIAETRDVLGIDFPIFEEFEDMAKSPDIDAIVITSPEKHHPWQMLPAIRAGKPTLCDKPWCIDTAGLIIVEEAAKLAIAKDVPLVTCLPRREPKELPYGRVLAKMAEWRRKYGKLQYIKLDFSYHIPHEEWKRGRDLMLDHIWHELDFALLMAGEELRDVWRLSEEGRFDQYTAVGRTKGGTSFFFNGSRHLETSTYPEAIELRFDRRTIFVNTKTGLMDEYDPETERHEWEFGEGIDYDKRSAKIMADFAAAIEHGKADVGLITHLLQLNKAAISLATHGHYESMS